MLGVKLKKMIHSPLISGTSFLAACPLASGKKISLLTVKQIRASNYVRVITDPLSTALYIFSYLNKMGDLLIAM